MTSVDSDVAPGLNRRRFDLAFAVLAALAFVTFLWLAREMTFRIDEWDFVLNRRLDDPLSLLAPFNEQWVTVPAIVFRLIFGVVGLHSYLPYLVVLLLLHVVVAAGTRAIIRSVAGEPIAFAAGVIVLFLGVGYENLDQGFQIGMVLAAGCGIWAIDLLVVNRRPLPAATLLLVSVASHAVGAAFLGACMAYVLIGDRRSAGPLIVTTIALGVWLALFDLPSAAARSGSFAAALAAIPAFVAAGMFSLAGAVFGLTWVAGVVIVAALALAAVRLRWSPERPRVAAVAYLAMVLELALIAISRAEYGLESVGWSRYLYVGVPLFLIGTSALVGDRITPLNPERKRLAGTALIALVLVAIVGNIRAYLVALPLTMEVVEQTRVAAVVAETYPDLASWEQELHLPEPATLRTAMARSGSPARDDLIPPLVPAISRSTAVATCEQLVPSAVVSCVDAVTARIGIR